MRSFLFLFLKRSKVLRSHFSLRLLNALMDRRRLNEVLVSQGTEFGLDLRLYVYTLTFRDHFRIRWCSAPLRLLAWRPLHGLVLMNEVQTCEQLDITNVLFGYFLTHNCLKSHQGQVKVSRWKRRGNDD